MCVCVCVFQSMTIIWRRISPGIHPVTSRDCLLFYSRYIYFTLFYSVLIYFFLTFTFLFSALLYSTSVLRCPLICSALFHPPLLPSTLLCSTLLCSTVLTAVYCVFQASRQQGIQHNTIESDAQVSSWHAKSVGTKSLFPLLYQ